MRPVIPKIATPGIQPPLRIRRARDTLVDRAGKELLDALEERLLTRLMAALLERWVEFLQNLLLLGVKTEPRLDHHATKQIAGAAAANRPHALLAHAKYPPGLGLARNLDDHLAVQRRHFHRSAERGRGEADRHLAGEMAALALENGVLPDADLHVQITGRAAVAAGLALAVQANAISGIDARGNGHRQGLLLADPPLAIAGVARITDDLAAPLASGAGLLDGENGLLHAHLALAMAGIAGLGRGTLGGSRALTG